MALYDEKEIERKNREEEAEKQKYIARAISAGFTFSQAEFLWISFQDSLKVSQHAARLMEI